MILDYVFEWDLTKELKNVLKHGLSFGEAIEVFQDSKVMHVKDEDHSKDEERFYAVGKVFSGAIVTVRYTRRDNVIRIFGAACWRKWRKFYEQNS